MPNYNLKFGFLQKKTGTVNDKDVFNSKDELIGKYSGGTKGGLFHGKGTLVVSRYAKDDLSYSGDFNEGKFHGSGVLIDTKHADYEKYEGEFNNDEFHGEGVLYYDGGGKFEGTFDKGIRIKGKLTFTEHYKNIKEYSGMFGNGNWGTERKNGKPNYPGGRGKITYFNGDVYEGGISDEDYFVRDYLDGIDCKITYADGAIFEGSFDKDKKSWGKHQLPDGTYYKGNWDGEIRTGKGVQVYKDGSKYEGEWKDDKRNGSGKTFYSDGSKYEGEWKDDKRHGSGTLSDKDDFIIHKGEWLDDDFVDDSSNNKISID